MAASIQTGDERFASVAVRGDPRRHSRRPRTRRRSGSPRSR